MAADEIDPTWFANRLRELREAAGLERKELAARAGLRSEAGIRDLEQGRVGPTWKTVLAICNALGVTPDAFTVEPAPRDPAGPGRPPRAEPEETPAPKRKRGRPRKEAEESEAEEPKKKSKKKGT
jgi:transcriptional regulator with XRE-family HTH domain